MSAQLLLLHFFFLLQNVDSIILKKKGSLSGLLLLLAGLRSHAGFTGCKEQLILQINIRAVQRAQDITKISTAGKKSIYV